MLIDQFGRSHTYLRIAVTDRCNLRCNYCIPAEPMALQPRSQLLSYAEIERLAKIFVDLGIRKIRITGGEPLVRSGIEDLCASLGEIGGLETLALSTNGVHLERKLAALLKAGVSELNISLDTLCEDRFYSITGSLELEAVINAIAAATKYRDAYGRAFDSIKINMVVRRGVNDDELLDMIQFGEALAGNSSGVPTIEMRLIEFMPQRGIEWQIEECVSYREMLDTISSRYKLTVIPAESRVHGPAKTLSIAGSRLRIGFITSMTESFCDSCNRLRLTPDGHLRICLFGEDGPSLREMLRSGADDAEIAAVIRSAVLSKWEGHPHHTELLTLNDRDMVAIGG